MLKFKTNITNTILSADTTAQTIHMPDWLKKPELVVTGHLGHLKAVMRPNKNNLKGKSPF